ncbi:MAG: hypothetical protein CMO17_01420 [Thaumarchaeota archaeon]|jgi:hypothetical protein|uniref:Uncharacterized protein n=1 Tax=uncultured marine thaumarchaeote SAT1000_48_A08 TaxID=1456414 RepID=A0A075IG05_9ARCH|nr:hypothetical protein [uncultured marine thaumarchaeote SAT1000_48_A08]MAY24206.1 hypothetical protein [Nitrososphaerota archaeon]|tara:strand:- start:3349 stop:3561 length:213 start_codon:yes stop_codon:yes gene_type:complete
MDEDTNHVLLMDIKRIDSAIEKLDNICKKFDEERIDAAMTLLKIKSALENIRQVLPHMRTLLDEENNKTS